ncbi:MAG: hypothetical protein BYD32DRAFT_414913 [Podila humilis]|nr:MAG: hypothetical protein BYD32DRAFT_414913 [Podila humilis]
MFSNHVLVFFLSHLHQLLPLTAWVQVGKGSFGHELRSVGGQHTCLLLLRNWNTGVTWMHSRSKTRSPLHNCMPISN